MKLEVKERAKTTKSAVKAVRREGDIPAVLYSSTGPTKMLVVDGEQFSTLLRGIKQGRLSTSVFNLHGGGKECRAIVKDIQYHPTTYRVLHLDFEELHDKVPVNVNVPISFTGVVGCIGIKLGGFLRQVIRTVRVRCLPKQIPSEFVVDVQELGINQTKRLADINMPQGVTPLAALNEVVVVIAKR